ncbi:MAG: hypothetical protein ABSC71_11030 [Candidatus Acidiferrales bacterium]
MLQSEADEIIERYVSCFSKFDDMEAFEGIDPIATELAPETLGEYGEKHWQPLKVETPRPVLDSIYAKLPARFPPLHERLVLSYRWAEVDLGTYRLVANPPGSGLDGLFREMTGDEGLRESLLPAGYIQFGKGPDVNYDPVCFDLNARKKNREFRIVQIDHEEILCNYRIKVVHELAPSFDQLVRHTIERAAQIK